MDYVVLQIVTAIGLFLSLIVCSYVPYCIIQYRDRTRSTANNKATRRKSSIPLLSLCNCFAAGVFLATCFLGMLPHVRSHVNEWMERQERNRMVVTMTSQHEAALHNASSPRVHKMEKHATPWTEILLIGGFLMVLTLEEVINLCQRYCGCCGRRPAANNGGSGDHHGTEERVTRIFAGASENEPLMSDDDEGDDVGTRHSHARVADSTKLSPENGGLDHVRMRDMGTTQRFDLSSHEHDHHQHHHIDASLLLSPGGRSLSWKSVALLLGLGIHGVFEGIALGLQDTSQAVFSLLFGIMSHEALCAMAFGINLASNRASIGVAFLTAVLFSLSIPFGMAAGALVNHHSGGGGDSGGTGMVRIALEGLAAGTFVYVCFMDMLAHELVGGDKTATDGPWRMVKVLCVCAGFLLFLGLTFVA